MKIPFVDLRKQYNTIATEITKAIKNVIEDTTFVNGKYVQNFEENFARFCDAKYSIGVGNGTDALFISLKSFGIGEGDEVIVPANSFIATSEAVTMAGAKVVFADCDATTYNIDTRLLEKKITNKTKAIIPVHLYGQPADMEALVFLANKYALKIIQDCAQAHGATINNQSLIRFGDVLCYSFYPGKNLGAYGDAGAIVTNEKEIAEKCKMFANHGRISKYDHEFEGINSRMDGIQGAVLDVKLRYLNEWTEKRIVAAELYSHLLDGLPGIVTPAINKKYRHVYHLYVIRTERREELRAVLQRNGAATGIHYPIALPNLKAYRYLKHSPDDFPVATSCQNKILSLPIFPEISQNQIEFVCEKIRGFCC